MSAKFLAWLHPNQHTEGEGKPDPHADYRVNPYSYLAIDGVTGEYSISREPKEIPKGFHIRLHEKVSGLRTFKVSKDGADTYDIVYTGTMMVQNNIAYISGERITFECPYYFLAFVRFPPFAISYPLEPPAGMKEEFHAKIFKDYKKKLIKIILENPDNDINKKGILDFDLSRKLVLRPPLPLKCYTCKGELQICGDSNFCRVCDFEGSTEVEHIKSEPERMAELEWQLQESKGKCAQLRSNFRNKRILLAKQKAKIQTLESCLKEKEREYKAEIKKLESRLKEKETEYKAENKKLESCLKETEYTSELETARAAEREALIKAERVTEQLQAAEASLREVGSMLGTILPRTYTDVDDVVLKKRRMS